MLKVRPVELATANMFINGLHRHHKAPQGHRFSLGVFSEGHGAAELVGVAVIGRPVGREVDPVDKRAIPACPEVVEVTRLCTNGTKNACSILYAAAARVAREMGYRKIQTYILASESGVSLTASGWIKEAEVRGRAWVRGGVRSRNDHPTEDKERWVKHL